MERAYSINSKWRYAMLKFQLAINFLRQLVFSLTQRLHPLPLGLQLTSNLPHRCTHAVRTSAPRRKMRQCEKDGVRWTPFFTHTYTFLAQTEPFTSMICNTAGLLDSWGCIHETPRSNLEAVKRPGNQPAGHPVISVGKM